VGASVGAGLGLVLAIVMGAASGLRNPWGPNSFLIGVGLFRPHVCNVFYILLLGFLRLQVEEICERKIKFVTLATYSYSFINLLL
jgi:hypothetical protein